MTQSLVARAALATLMVAAPLIGQSSGEHKAAVLERLTALEQALVDWNAAIGAGDASVSGADIADVRGAFGGLETHVRALMEAARGGDARTTKGEPALSDTWGRALLSTDRSADYERALDEVAAALNGDDEQHALSGIRALTVAHDVAMDRSRFREGIVRWFENGDNVTRHAAAYALGLDRQPGDLARIQSLWPTDDATLRGSLSHLLMLFGQGTIEGRSEEIVLELLADEQGRELREVLRGLWGAHTSDVIQARLVALEEAAHSGGQSSTRHDVLYFALSTSPNKNAAVVDRLLVAVTDSDHNSSGRALWGLRYGIESPDDRLRVAEALVELHNTRVAPELRQDVRRIVEQYGSPSLVDQLN